MAADFLEALIAYTQTVPALAGIVTTESADPPAWPYVVLANYDEYDAGETLEDRTVTLTLSVHHADLPSLRAFSRAVKAAVDSVAINPDSTRAGPLAWSGGRETGVVRDHSRIRQLRPTRGGVVPWREAIEYTFWISTD